MSQIAEINLEEYCGKGKPSLLEREADLNTLLLQLIVIVNELVRKVNRLEDKKPGL